MYSARISDNEEEDTDNALQQNVVLICLYVADGPYEY